MDPGESHATAEQGGSTTQVHSRDTKSANGISIILFEGRKAERQKGRKAERQKGRKAERQKGRKAERQKGRKAERQKVY
jgi:hypothetical protein